MERFYSLSELERVLEIPRRTVLEYIRDGELSAVWRGNSWKVAERELTAFLSKT